MIELPDINEVVLVKMSSRSNTAWINKRSCCWTSKKEQFRNNSLEIDCVRPSLYVALMSFQMEFKQ